MSKDDYIGVRVSNRLATKLDTIAEQHGFDSRSELVRHILISAIMSSDNDES